VSTNYPLATAMADKVATSVFTTPPSMLGRGEGSHDSGQVGRAIRRLFSAYSTMLLNIYPPIVMMIIIKPPDDQDLIGSELDQNLNILEKDASIYHWPEKFQPWTWDDDDEVMQQHKFTSCLCLQSRTTAAAAENHVRQSGTNHSSQCDLDSHQHVVDDDVDDDQHSASSVVAAEEGPIVVIIHPNNDDHPQHQHHLVVPPPPFTTTARRQHSLESPTHMVNRIIRNHVQNMRKSTSAGSSRATQQHDDFDATKTLLRCQYDL
jgi:hypothetical protein